MADEQLKDYPAVADWTKFLKVDPQYKASVSQAPIENATDTLNENIKTYDFWGIDSFFDGFKASPIGTWIRRTQQGTYHPMSRYKPTKEERDKIGESLKWDIDKMDYVLDNAESFEDVQKNLDLLAENERIEKQFAESPWYTSIAGAIGSAMGNPIDIATTALSFVPVTAPVAVSAKVARTAKVGASIVAGVAANQYQDYVTGMSHDIWADVGAMVGLTVGLHGVGKLHEGLSTVSRKVSLVHDKLLNGEEVPTGLLSEVGKATLPLARRLNDFREQITSGLPSIEIKQRLLGFRNDGNDELKEFIGKLTHWEQGVRTPDGYKQYINEPKAKKKSKKKSKVRPNTTTAFEEVKNLQVESGRLFNDLPNDVDKAARTYDRETLNSYLYDKVAGFDVSRYGPDIDTDPLVQKIVSNLQEHYRKRGDLLVSLGLVSGKFKFRGYLPMIIDRWKMHNFINAQGDDKAAGDYLKRYLVDGVLKDEQTNKQFRDIWKVRYQKELEAKAKADPAFQAPSLTPEKEQDLFMLWLDEEAQKASYGYRDQNYMHNQVDNFDDSAKGFSFQKHRMPWNSAYMDASGFTLNSLRGDIVDSSWKYFQRTNGLIADKRVYGKDFADVSKEIDRLDHDFWEKNKNRNPSASYTLKRDLDVMHRRLYGMALNPARANFSYADAFALMFRNLAYGDFGTMMGVLNYGEVASAIQAYGASIIIKMLPGVHELYSRFGKGQFSQQDLRAWKDYVIGREISDQLNVREIMRLNRQNLKDLHPFMATAVGISDVFARYSPANFVQRYSQESIIDTVQNAFLTELARKALGKTVDARGFARELDLKRLNISRDDFEYTLKTLKEYVGIDGKNDLYFSKDIAGLRDNQRAMNVIQRLTNYVSEETLQRRNLDDIFTFQLINNPFLNLAMQFKSFALQSYNKRLVKFMNRLEDEGAMAQFINFAWTTALTGLVTLAQINARTVGMSDEDKEKYLKNTLGVESMGDFIDGEGLWNLMFQSAFNRNPYTASIALALNTVGIGTSAKTTAGTRGANEESWFVYSPKVGNLISDMMPAFRIVESLLSFGTGVYNLGANAITDDYTQKERDNTAKQLMRGLNALPYLPVLSPTLKSWAKEEAEGYKYGY